MAKGLAKAKIFFSYIYYYWSEKYRCLEYFVIKSFVILKFHCIKVYVYLFILLS